MKAKYLSLSLFLIPVLASCHGAYITYEAAKEIKDSIQTKVLDPNFDPYISSFTRKEYRVSGANNRVIQKVFNREQLFYTEYEINNNSKSPVQEYYRFVINDTKYNRGLCVYDLVRKDGKWDPDVSVRYEFSTVEERDEYFIKQYVDVIQNNIIEETKSTLNNMNSVFINYVDSEDIPTNVAFMSENEQSLYFECKFDEEAEDSEKNKIINHVTYKFKYRNLLINSYEKYVNDADSISIGYNYGKASFNIPDYPDATKAEPKA